MNAAVREPGENAYWLRTSFASGVVMCTVLTVLTNTGNQARSTRSMGTGLDLQTQMRTCSRCSRAPFGTYWFTGAGYQVQRVGALWYGNEVRAGMRYRECV